MNDEEFSDAFRRGYPVTFRFLTSRGVPFDSAEEIAQAAWVKGWECRSQLHQRSLVGAWVNSIAINMLRNRLHLEKRFEHLTKEPGAQTNSQPSMEVDQILRLVPERDGTLLRRYYMEGYNSNEIAARLGLTPTAVRVRLLRLRRVLRISMEAVSSSTLTRKTA